MTVSLLGEECAWRAFQPMRVYLICTIDIAMPDLLGGLQFVPRLRAALPGVGIIALTLLGINGYRQAALEAGVDDFVPKVAMGADLLAAIRRVRQAHRTWGKIADFAGSTEVKYGGATVESEAFFH